MPGLIHLSSEMYESVMTMTNVFDYSCCGKLDIKGKGEMITYVARPLENKLPFVGSEQPDGEVLTKSP